MKFLTLALMGLLVMAGSTAKASFMGSAQSVTGGVFQYAVAQGDATTMSLTGASATDYVYMYQLRATTPGPASLTIPGLSSYGTLALLPGRGIGVSGLGINLTVTPTNLEANGLSFVGNGLSEIVYLISSVSPASGGAATLVTSAGTSVVTGAPVPVPLPPAIALAFAGLPMVRLLRRKAK